MGFGAPTPSSIDVSNIPATGPGLPHLGVRKSSISRDHPLGRSGIDGPATGHWPGSWIERLSNVRCVKAAWTLDLRRGGRRSEREGVANDAVPRGVLCSDFIRLPGGKSPQFFVVLLPERRAIKDAPPAAIIYKGVGRSGGEVPRPERS